MKRLDWLDRLFETLERHRPLPFLWGQNDCCTFAATCIDAMSGTRHLERLLTNYHDEETARAYIAAGGGLPALISSYLGKPMPLRLIAPGDIVIARRLGWEAVGVCYGDRIAVPTRAGLGTVGRGAATHAWRV